MANFQVFDAYGSVITIQSSTFGTAERQIVGVSVIGAIPTTPSGNQSVSGTVGASVIGLTPVNVTGTPSISGAVNITGNSSILTVHVVDDQIVSSMVSIVTDTIIHGKTSAGGGTYVEVKVDPSGAIVTAMSSVVAFQGGTRVTSIVSTVPSSVIVGASIFGQLPGGTATIGAVTAPAGSVATTTHLAGSVTGVRTDNASVITLFQNSSIISLHAPVASFVSGTADLRTQQGGSVAALASPGTGIRNYVTAIQVSNFGPSSVLVTIADNTTSTLGWTIAPAGGGSNFNPLYRAAANSPVTASINGTASVLVSMQGFTL